MISTLAIQRRIKETNQVTVDITIRARTEADDPAIVAILNATRPWLPPTSVDDFRWQIDPANSPPNQVWEHWVAVYQERIVGIYDVGESMFVAREHTFSASLSVAEANRNQGIGDRLFHHMMDRADAHGATRIYSHVSEDNHVGAAFAEVRGFLQSGRVTRLSRLTVSEASLDGHDEALERVRASGIDFKTMDEIGLDDESLLRTIFDMTLESAKDVPSTEKFGAIPFEVWIKWISSPNSATKESWIAFDHDRPVGVAAMSRRGEASSFNDYTGVDRAYRGRGIARALKIKTIQSARNAGIVSIFTANDLENKPMLAINIPLGYKAVPAEIEIVKDT